MLIAACRENMAVGKLSYTNSMLPTERDEIAGEFSEKLYASHTYTCMCAHTRMHACMHTYAHTLCTQPYDAHAFIS